MGLFDYIIKRKIEQEKMRQLESLKQTSGRLVNCDDFDVKKKMGDEDSFFEWYSLDDPKEYIEGTLHWIKGFYFVKENRVEEARESFNNSSKCYQQLEELFPGGEGKNYREAVISARKNAKICNYELQ